MKISDEQIKSLLEILQARFEKNQHRHADIKWEAILARIENDSEKLWSLSEMERTGGEPDVIAYNSVADEYLFCDCVAESPKARRSICYDHAALEARKKFKPKDSAMNVAQTMGVTITTEEEYRLLQSHEAFDTKTSSWLKTPDAVRELGGALFGDFRFGRVFVYHNGAESYYGSRGFRGILRV
ncbi:MAG: DUF4256 domain-containing protein [Cyclobacteriaceae bacterium]